LKGLLNQKFEDYSSGISIGKKLEDIIIDRIENGPTQEYLNYYHRINEELREVVEKISTELKETGLNSLAIPPTVASSSLEKKKDQPGLRYDLSHKMVATRAGLGWIGKTDLFISKKFGPRLRLTSILVKEEIPLCGRPIEKSRCGKCNVCVEKCPAGAATGELWNINLDRDIFFNVFKCSDNCSSITKRLLNADERICGICVSVCPIGRKNKLMNNALYGI
jgi:epoxyqueuosine reductase QueG